MKAVKNKYGVPVSYRGKVPTRCNQRSCQARRTLGKYPEEFVHGWPKCHKPGCPGEMYVDRTRLQSKFKTLYPEHRDKDRGKTCTCKGHPRKHPYGKVTDLYRCVYADEAVIEKSLTKGTFVHSPEKQLELCNDREEIPF